MLITLVAEHRETNSRTGYSLTPPPHVPLETTVNNDLQDVNIIFFQIVSGNENLVGLHIAESLPILRIQIKLNLLFQKK